MDKENLRIQYIKLRKSIENKAFLSDIITNNVLKTPIYANSKNIGIYVSLENEVSTKKLILQSLEDKKQVSVPVVKGNELSFYTISCLEDLCNTDNFGIKEPICNKENLIDKNSIDLLIVPGICFDVYGNRIGYGKGFYDKFIVNLDIIKLGLCFEEQLLKDEKIPVDKTDIPMDLIITEKSVISTR